MFTLKNPIRLWWRHSHLSSTKSNKNFYPTFSIVCVDCYFLLSPASIYQDFYVQKKLIIISRLRFVAFCLTPILSLAREQQKRYVLAMIHLGWGWGCGWGESSASFSRVIVSKYNQLPLFGFDFRLTRNDDIIFGAVILFYVRKNSKARRF